MVPCIQLMTNSMKLFMLNGNHNLNLLYNYYLKDGKQSHGSLKDIVL